MDSNSFLSFDKMISQSLIKFIYVLGAIFITLFGVLRLFGIIPGIGGAFVGILTGLVVIIFGNLMWRVTCEIWILFFSMHDKLVKIEDNTKTTGERVPGTPTA